MLKGYQSIEVTKARMKRMKELHLIQITRRRQIASPVYERLVGHLVVEMSKRISEPQIAPMRLTGKVSENVVTSPSEIVPECGACGACCAFYTCVAVAKTDTVPRTHYWKISGREGTSSAASATTVAGRQMRRDPVTNNCIAFEGEVGKAVRCGIYNRRPAVCRNFEAGSDQCYAARRAFGLEPPLTAEQVTIAERRLAKREAENQRCEQRKELNLVSIDRRRNSRTVESRGKAVIRDLTARRDAA